MQGQNTSLDEEIFYINGETVSAKGMVTSKGFFFDG